MTPAPQIFRWDGRVMQPLRPALAQLSFKPGEVYRLSIDEERSSASHAHYFAAIVQAWRNLPPHLAEYFETPDHLRKRALIEAGFYDQETIACGSHETACRVAAFAGRKDTHALISVYDSFVIIRTAKSQSRRHMSAAEFQASKEKVLEILAGMIAVKPAELEQNAEA